MSLVTFAVIGKDKSPIYLRDFEHESLYDQLVEKEAYYSTGRGDGDGGDDPFGFFDRKKYLNESSSLKNQVRTEEGRVASY